MAARKDLGSILVDENVIGGKDLERLDRKGRPLWHALLEGRLTTEDELYFVMAKRFGAPVLAESEIAEAQLPANDNVRRALGREQALEAGMLPIDVAPDGQRCTVVMVDPSDEATLAAFLVRAKIPEGRAVLGRRSAIEQAIERVFHNLGHKNVSQRVATGAPVSYHHDEVTGTVKLDPSLAAEIAQLPQRVLKAEPLTPVPSEKRAARKKPVDPEDKNKLSEPQAEERFSRALIQAVEVLVGELERRLGGGGGDQSGAFRLGTAKEMGRLARRVARQLGLSRRIGDEIGVAAELYAIDALMKKNEGVAAEIFGELGWPAAGEGGMLPILRALTAASSGFGRVQGQKEQPLGARIIYVVADYLELGAAASETQLETVSQLLRASSAGAPVVDALLRVLEQDRDGDLPAEKTTVTAQAHSLLKELADTPPPAVVPVEDSTQKKLIPPPRRPQKE
jgi:hypothetical protein